MRTSRERDYQEAGTRRSRTQQSAPQQTKRKKKRRKLDWQSKLGVLAMLIGVLLLLADPIKSYLVNQAANSNTMGNLTAEQLRANQERDVNYDGSVVEAMTFGNVVNAVSSVNPEDLPTVAGIAVPNLGVNLPIYKGISNEAMYMGAVTLLPDIEMGVSNYSISSHHSKFPGVLFQPLTKAEIGEIIYTTDLETMFTWEVTERYTVTPDKVEVMDPTPFPQLTLITCTYDLSERIIVEAQLVDRRPYEQSTPEQVEAFEMPVLNDA